MLKSSWKYIMTLGLSVTFLCGLVILALFVLIHQRQSAYDRSIVVNQARELESLSRIPSLSLADFTRLIEQRTRRGAKVLLTLRTKNGLYGSFSVEPRGLPTAPGVALITIGLTNEEGQPVAEQALGTAVDTRYGRLSVILPRPESRAYVSLFWGVGASTMLLAALLAVGLSYVYMRYVDKRLFQYSSLVQEIRQGNRKGRVPITHHNDEYDVIAGHINAMLDEMDRLLELAQGITDNIAHDLRTPLTRIRLALEKELENAPDELRSVSLQSIVSDLDIVIDTFSAMLELTSIEVGKKVCLDEECRVDDILDDVAELLKPVAESRKQNMIITIHSPHKLQGNRLLFFRAIYNLCDNAVKYTPEGGNIRLSLSGGVLEISDTGPGIPDAQKAKVFDRLYRGDSSRRERGYGLGLSLVKAVMDLHGASITLSDNQPGLRVRVELPRQVELA